MTRTLPALLASLALISGCVTPPQRSDPFAGLSERPAAYRDLTLGLILSENTRKAADYAGNYSRKVGGLGDPRVNEAANELFRELSAIFERNFKTVIKIDNADGIATAHADFGAVLDIFLELPNTFMGTVKVEAKTIFLKPDQGTIDVIEAKESRVAYRYALGVSAAVKDASAAAVETLESSMRGSVKLQEFARTRPSPSAAVLGAAPAPAARSYRSGVDRPSYHLPANPKNFALVVGIEKYAGVPEALFAERDAAAVKEHLLALGYPERNILYLTGQQASRASLAKDLESWLPRNIDESSNVFFFFSGHGAPDVKGGEAYLLPWDGDPQSLELTAYPLKRLYEKLNALKAKKVIVALDACFSGAGGRSILAKGARPLVTKVDTAKDALGKLVVFAASAADEITATDQAQGHGLFTYHFLEGLEAKGGEITVKGLYDYLLPRVQDAARRDNRDQTPQLIPTDLGDRASLRLR